METNQQPAFVPPTKILKVVPGDPDDTANEFFETTVQQLREWLSSIYPSSKIERAMSSRIEYYVPQDFEMPDHPLAVSERPKSELHIQAKIWTSVNVYRIYATINHDGSHTYLGCGASARKSRPGETWTRGNDLPDGKFNEETWQRILAGIVRYEAEEVRSEKWKE